MLSGIDMGTTTTERCNGARRQISWASMAELDSVSENDSTTLSQENSSASERTSPMPFLPDNTEHTATRRQISWASMADLGESCDQVYRACSPYSFTQNDDTTPHLTDGSPLPEPNFEQRTIKYGDCLPHSIL